MPRNFRNRFFDMKLLVKSGSKGRFAPAFGGIGSKSELVQVEHWHQDFATKYKK